MGEYWQCSGCGTVDEVPCWSPEACLVCEEPYDGSGWSEQDEPVCEDESLCEDLEEDQEEQGHRGGHKIAGCPENCDERHLFDFELELSKEPKPGETVEVTAKLSPAVDENGKGSLTWKITEGAKLASLAEEGDSELETDATDNVLSLTFEPKAKGAVVLEVTFLYGGKLDLPEVRTLSMHVPMARLPGEVDRSLESEFKLVELGKRYLHTVPETSFAAKAWVLYDFGVGSPALEKKPSVGHDVRFGKLMSKVLRRVGEECELISETQAVISGEEKGKVWRRVLALKGYADGIDPNESNATLRDSRRSVVEQYWEHYFPAVRPWIFSVGQLWPAAKKNVDALGPYPFSNSTEEGRAKNRCVILFEVFVDISDEVAHERERERKEDECALMEARVAHLDDWWKLLEAEGGLMTPLLAVASTGGRSPKDEVRKLLQKCADGEPWNKLLSAYNSLDAPTREVYYSARDVDHHTIDKPGKEVPDLAERRHSITGSLADAARRTSPHDEEPGEETPGQSFVSKAMGIPMEVLGGTNRLVLRRNGLHGGFVDVHLGVIDLLRWLEQRYTKSGQLYNVFKEQVHAQFFKSSIFGEDAPEDEG